MENLVGSLTTLKQCYNGKRVFLTGHTGFKGTWMLKVLHLLGAEIRGYALESLNDDDLYELISGDKLGDSIIADLRDRDSLLAAVSEFQPDFIFHLAAQPLVRLSYEIPSETFEVNAIGTANLLDAVKNLKKKCTVVLITTDKVYYNNEWDYPYRENDKLGGHDPYSASKACAELVIDSYKNSFFNVKNYWEHLKGVAIGRSGNVIGGGDWSKDRLIPDTMKALSANKNVFIRNPDAIRPWQHVLEPVIAYLNLGNYLNREPLKYAQAYNFGPYNNDTLTVREMVQLLIEIWGKGKAEYLKAENQYAEAGLLKLDISKAMNQLAWKPLLSAHDAVNDTVSWYKMYNTDPKVIAAFTEQQILNYISKMA
ncbi:CDP-glucose 4,6-dehydratase [Pedobacter sp. WC2423]|uniref:CDP-glucose 4,6-dehydratase n=1 Tax=Pedobacter sp. WC2423 TaxID=3234142 RepID=UPI003465E65E